MQVSCFGTELESAGPPGALILNNAYPTVDSRQTEFECGPSHEWRETRLLTIQITGERPTVETDSATAAGSGLHCWQASREARPDARAHAQTDAHVGTLTNGCTRSPLPRAKCSRPPCSARFTAQTLQGPRQTCARGCRLGRRVLDQLLAAA